MKPLIGITPSRIEEENSFGITFNYCRAVEKCGGIPLILSYTNYDDIDSLINLLDGVLLTGGGDPDPLLFGEEPLWENGYISPTRDLYELILCSQAIKRDIPVLGICRGMQIMCVASGGKLYQDIKTQTGSKLKHRQEAPNYYPTHLVKVTYGSLLSMALGCTRDDNELAVNSMHHQCVREPGEDFYAAAFSSDGLIEAIEHSENKFAIGVQWHPECMFEKSERQLNLFRLFIEKSKK